MCHCLLCGNLKNALVFFNKLGRCLKNRVVENISPDNVISYCVCLTVANKDFKHQFHCLHAQQAKHCFIHTKRVNTCARCVHVCDNSFKQFINSEIEFTAANEFYVPLDYFDLSEKRLPSWVPASDQRSKSLL